ncbi:MAG: Hpt domain-containing protein [Bacteroidetes bacterium]|nr:Hpt domain-containing protein [Bacteroidota bacterium]
MENKKKYIDLTYLTELSNGSEEFIDKMIGIFIEQAPEAIGNLETHLQSKNWQGLKATAHKMKSSISIMGITELEAVVTELEANSEKEINSEKAPELVKKIKEVTEAAIEELKVIK